MRWMDNLKPSDVKSIKNIIRKARKAKSLSEINHYNEQLKRIDAKNRRKAVTNNILARYKNSESL